MLFIFPKNYLRLLNYSPFVLVKINSGSETTWREVCTPRDLLKGIWLHTGVEAASTVSVRVLVFVSSDKIDTHRAGSQEGKTDWFWRTG